MRLDPNTPARQSLKEYIQPDKKPQGRPKEKETWLAMIKKCLKQNGLQINYTSYETMVKDLENTCTHRKNWKTFVRNIKLM